MPNLYAINKHLQECLERNWRDGVRDTEAAVWLDESGLLPIRKSSVPLRNLLCDGRIAGQAQRPDQKNGSWLIRRLAQSRDPQAIAQARERLRCYLPIERANFPADWPANQGDPVFWQELGKTVAVFGYLEHTLASTCYTLLATAKRATDLLGAGEEARSQWFNRVLRSQVDSLHGLTRELDKVLHEDGRVSAALRKDLVCRLDALRPWRNALCHGAWLSVDKDGSGSLHHMYMLEGVPVAFPPAVTLKELSDIRTRTVDVVFRVVEAASIAGAGFALTVMPRMYEPRNTSPERE